MLVASSRGIAAVESVARRWTPVRPFAMAVAAVPVPQRPARMDRVSLSAAARERATRAAASAVGRRSVLGVLSDAVHADAAQAAWLAHDFAYFEDRPLLEVDRGPAPRYASTGEPVTPESAARFERAAATARRGRIAVYEAERAKGTEPAEIFEKLLDFMAVQSSDFLRYTGWQSVLARG